MSNPVKARISSLSDFGTLQKPSLQYSGVGKRLDQVITAVRLPLWLPCTLKQAAVQVESACRLQCLQVETTSLGPGPTCPLQPAVVFGDLRACTVGGYVAWAPISLFKLLLHGSRRRTRFSSHGKLSAAWRSCRPTEPGGIGFSMLSKAGLQVDRQAGLGSDSHAQRWPKIKSWVGSSALKGLTMVAPHPGEASKGPAGGTRDQPAWQMLAASKMQEPVHKTMCQRERLPPERRVVHIPNTLLRIASGPLLNWCGNNAVALAHQAFQWFQSLLPIATVFGHWSSAHRQGVGRSCRMTRVPTAP